MRVPVNATTEAWVRRAALLAGVAFVAGVVVPLRVPPGDGKPSADVYFLAGPTGELAVAPTGTVLSATGLRPGEAAHGSVLLTNQTGKRLDFRVRALPDSRDLDDVLRVRLRSGSASVFAGRLGALRTARPVLPIGSGQAKRLQLEAWLPDSVRSGYAGRVVTVPLEFAAVGVT